MPLSTIDPSVALLVVDLQRGLAQAPTVHPMRDVVQNSAELAAAFRARGLPVVLVTADGRAPGRTDDGSHARGPIPPEQAEVMPELSPADSDHRVVKRCWGAFTGTDLHATLQARGVTQVVVTGVATCAGVESTARGAHEHGYHVVLATDAMTDLDPDNHDHAIARIFPKLGESAPTADILACLADR